LPARVEIGPPTIRKTGQSLSDIDLHQGAAKGVIWNPQAGMPQVIDLSSLTPQTKLEVANWTRAALSPNGRWVTTSPFRCKPKYTTKVFDAVSGTLLHEFALEEVSGENVWVEFSGDNKWLATSTAEGVRLWSTETWQPGPVFNHSGSNWPGSMAFSPHGSLLALAHTPTSIELIDLKTLTVVATLTLPMSTRAGFMQFSPDESQLALTADQQACFLFDLRQIRNSLADLGLDWEQQPFAPATASPASLVVTVKRDANAD
jgi:WD40 repeat protein